MWNRVKVNTKLKGLKEYKVQKLIYAEKYLTMTKVKIWCKVRVLN